jgi:geranylgeranyl diphosphate synthase, type I
MTAVVLSEELLHPASIKGRVDEIAGAFLAQKARDAKYRTFAGVLRSFLAAGGKRIRPVMCVLGWHAAGGGGDEQMVYRWATGLEMFHSFALIHDDLMDGSATRHGCPTVHLAMAGRHPGGPGSPAAEKFGRNSAILVGDLALVWADELMSADGGTVAQAMAAWPLLHAMRSEVMVGQYLDVSATGQQAISIEDALQIIRFKTAKYTIERPLQIGAALGGGDDELLQACSAVALPLGEAFQLRDDLLGVFGDRQRTGKPVVDDLREGKATVLLGLTYQRATAGQRATLQRLVGAPDLDEQGAAAVRHIMLGLGAPRAVENLISLRYQQALDELDRAPFRPAAARALRSMAETIVRRAA